MIDASFVQQDAWGWQIAAYLFLGGLGGAVGALGITIERFFTKDGRLGLLSAMSGFVLLAVGSLLLVLDLMQPLNAIWFWRNPSSWIFWGILALSGYLVTSVLYSVACAKDSPFFRPLADKFPQLQKWQNLTGIVSALLGLFVTTYTGFLLSAAQGVQLWNSAALPVLFTVSAFSTGCAYLLLALWKRRDELHDVFQGIARLDAALIGAEIVVLFAIYNAALHTGAAWHSVQVLLGNWGFVLGFLLVGLAVPLAIELYEIFVNEDSKGAELAPRLLPLVSVFVLTGGFLLRYYVLSGGYHQFPW